MSNLRRPVPRQAAALPALAAAALLLAAGCATGGGGPAGGPGPADGDGPARAGTDGPPAGRSAGEGAWVRRVRGMTVLDSTGSPYAWPFLGGFDAPRPQLLDIDRDGDDDLFLQERTGEVMFFERVDRAELPPGRRAARGRGPAGSDRASDPASDTAVAGPPFVWRADAYRGLAVGDWYRFGDVDMDGDVDLLAEEPFSHVRYYRNDGEPGSPDFVPAADTLRTTGGEAIFSDRQNVPNVGDIDCDGRQDLLVGRLDGTVTRFEVAGWRESPEGERVPRFRRVTDRFQDIEIVAEFVGSLHGANSLVVTDFDGDGDPDLFWGDFFEAGLLYIENTGSCGQPNLRGRPVPFPPADPVETSGYNAATFGDLDGDGDRDLLLGVIGGAYNSVTTAADNVWYLENTDSGWERRAKRYLPGLDVGSESVPAFADLDGEGGPDLLLANKIDPDERTSSVIHRYERLTGTGGDGEPAWRQAGSLPMRGSYQYAPAFGDLDDDGDDDLVLGDWRDELTLHRNRGPGEDGRVRWEAADSALATLSRGSHAVPALGDLDGDGDLDLLVGEASGTINLFRNVGTPSEPDFELVSDAWRGIRVERRSAPALGDLDGDGDLDLLVGSSGQGIRLWRNEGTPSAPDFVDEGRLDADTRGLSAPALADVDGDGTAELFSGTASGGLLWFERDGGR